MAEWKKVIVSGSSPDFAAVNVDGTVTANAFSGDGSALTGVAAGSINIDGFTAGTVLDQADVFLYSDGGTEKKITFSNIEDEIFGNVSGDATIAAGGALTIANTSVTNDMLAGSIANAKLSNSAITIAGNSTSLGGSITTATILDGTGVVSGSAQISLGGDLSGTANSATVAKVQGVALTSEEATQLANIGSTTISSTQWGYLGAMDQGISSADGPTFTGLSINGTVAFNNVDDAQSFHFNEESSITTIATASVSQNLTVGGDLIVNGDLTYLNTTNTLVEDQFILLGSGSAEGTDKGIIFDGTDGTTGQGVAFFYDGGVSRLSYATAISHTATAVTPTAYIPLVFDVTGASHTAVEDAGNIKIESGEVYIYA